MLARLSQSIETTLQRKRMCNMRSSRQWSGARQNRPEFFRQTLLVVVETV
jgi:hypothetical protein